MPQINNGDVLEYTLVQKIVSQLTLTILHYRASGIAGTVDMTTHLVSFLNSWDAAPWNGVLAGLQSADVEFYRLRAQIISPTRYNYVELTPINVLLGSIVAGTLPPNSALSIEKRADLSGRHYRGATHVSGIPVTQVIDGSPDPAYVASMNNWATTIVSVKTVGTVTWTPIIYQRANPAASAQATNANTQSTFRTVRTRTVGVGI